MHPWFATAIVDIDGQKVVRAVGELDLTDASVLLETIVEIPSSAGPVVVVDLDQLSFIDLAGVRALRQAADCLERDGRRLVVRNAGGCVERVIALSGLADRFLDQQVPPQREPGCG